MWYRVVAGCMVLLMTACASQNEYIEPTVRKTEPSNNISNDITEPVMVNASITSTWQKLSSAFSSRGIVIDKPDQASSIMTIRYSGDPKTYIDCGKVVSKVNTSKGEKTYDFAAAKAFQQYQIQQNGKNYLIDRRMILDIRTLLKLENIGPLKTKVTLDSSTYGATRDQLVRGGGAKPFGVTDKIDFGLKDGAKFQNAATYCRATGKFEAEVLAIIKR
jgi:hypothetical protein